MNDKPDLIRCGYVSLQTICILHQNNTVLSAEHPTDKNHPKRSYHDERVTQNRQCLRILKEICFKLTLYNIWNVTLFNQIRLNLLQYIPQIIHRLRIFAVLCYIAIVYPYPSGLLHCHSGNHLNHIVEKAITKNFDGQYHEKAVLTVNKLRPRKNGCHFPDDIFKRIFLNENVWI